MYDDIFGNKFLRTERWPTMLQALGLELLECPTSRCDEERYATDTVVEYSFTIGIEFAEKIHLWCLEVARVFGISVIVAAYALGRVIG